MTSHHIWLVVILVFILSLPFLTSLVREGRVDLFQPPMVFSLYFLFGYVFPIPSFIEGTDRFSYLWPSPYWTLDKSLAGALTVATWGVIGFYLGYYLLGRLRFFGEQTPSSEAAGLAEWNLQRFFVVGLVYTLGGLGMFTIGVALLGGASSLLSGLGDRIRLFQGLNYFFLSINLLLVVSLIWWAYLLNHGRIRDIKFWSYTFFSLFFSALLGNKSTIFIFIVTAVLMFHLFYRRIPAWLTLCGAAIMFVFLTFYALFLREYLVVGEFVTFDTTNVSIASLFAPVQREFTGNFMQLQVLTVLVERMPVELPFQHGRTYLSLLTLPIPRGFWPEKPLPSTGVFTLAFWPHMWLNYGTTMPPSLIGEMYMNFGSLGVIIGTSAFGAMYRKALSRAYQNRRDVFAVMFYSLLVALMPHYLRGDFVGPTTILAILGLPLLLALRFVLQPYTQPGGSLR